MGVYRIALSPCLLYENENFFDWVNSYDTLSFIDQYLDCALDTYEGSFFHINSWYSNPKCDVNMMTYFSSHIIPLLRNLSDKGTEYVIKNTLSVNDISMDNNFIITNQAEFELMISYIYEYNNDCSIFVGTSNYGFNNSSLRIKYLEKELELNIPIVKNPWLDEYGNYNKMIKEDIKDYKNIFPCKQLCIKANKDYLEKGNKSLYRHWAEIIAERNGYKRLPYSDRQYKNVPYYLRNDKEYIICVDTLHGTYEVFRRSGAQYENYMGEFDFYCNKIINKTSLSDTHKCYKYY